MRKSAETLDAEAEFADEDDGGENARSVRLYPIGKDTLTLRVMPEREGEQISVWDGANQSAVRDVLQENPQKNVMIDMTGIRHLPTGTFAMFYNQAELGRNIYLYSPEPEVQRMYWFRIYARHQQGCMYRMDLSGDISMAGPLQMQDQTVTKLQSTLSAQAECVPLSQ
jgi:hypothetical protein